MESTVLVVTTSESKMPSRGGVLCGSDERLVILACSFATLKPNRAALLKNVSLWEFDCDRSDVVSVDTFLLLQ